MVIHIMTFDRLRHFAGLQYVNMGVFKDLQLSVENML